MVDFNNPIAGKDVTYDLKVLRKLDDVNEQLKAFNEFLFKKDFKAEIQDKKIILTVEKPMVKFVELFKDKFKDIFGKDIEIKEVEAKKTRSCPINSFTPQ